jgi:deoxyribonuclease V
VEAAAFAREGDGKFDEGGDAGTVDLGDVVEINDHFASALVEEILCEVAEMLAGLADGKATIDVKVMNAAGFARRNFQWWMKRHQQYPQYKLNGCCPLDAVAGSSAQHYTMKGMKKKRAEAHRTHRWDVTPAEAREIQERLRVKWEGRDRMGEIRTVAGLDVAFVVTESQALKKNVSRRERLREANQAIACVVVYQLLLDPRAPAKVPTPQLEEIERAYAVVPLEFPYIPGLLSFREIPALLAALGKLKAMPDLLFCDGQGYAHPRRLGLAAHLGVRLDWPTIGCAKSILIGEHSEVGQKAGSWGELVDPKNGERIGAAVRTRDGVRPVYVSQGNRMSLETAIRMTLAVSDGFRIPRPTRDADRFASEVKRKIVGTERNS